MNDQLTEKQRRRRELREPRKGSRRRHRRRYRKRLGLWRLFSIAFLLTLLFLAGLSVSGRSVALPTWVTQQVAVRVNGSLTSGRITIGQLLLQVNKRGVPGLKMRNLGIFDERGAELVRLNEVGARVSVEALFQGQLKPESISLTGAQMTLRRRNDGQVDLSLGGGAGATVSLAGVLDVLDEALAVAPLDNVDAMTAEELTINVEDGRSGRLWQITDGRMQLERMPDGLDITVAFDVFNGTEDLAEIVIGIRTDDATSAATIATTFKNAAAADIALQSPILSFLGVLNAPISGALRAEFEASGTLESLAGTLEVGAGALQPTGDTPPVSFDSGKAYFSYDPTKEKITFSELSVKTDAIALVAKGHAYLRDYVEGWPSTLLAQFALADLVINPQDLFDAPVTFSQGAMDFRVRLSPFIVDVGQFVLVDGDEKLRASGKISASNAGWDVASDMSLNQISSERLMALWPPAAVPKTRKWLSQNISNGFVRDATAAFRLRPGEPLRRSVGFRFEGATVRYIKTLPVIRDAAGFGTIAGKRFTLGLERGAVTSPAGGEIDLAGSKMWIDDLKQRPATMHLALAGKSSPTSVLGLLNEPPFKVLKNTKLPVDMVEGKIDFDADVSFLLKKKVLIEDVTYAVAGILRDVSSDILVKGRTLTADALSLRANNDVVEISGPAQLGAAVGDVTWHQAMGPENAGVSNVTGTVDLSQGFVDEFNIGLPKGSVSGSGTGVFDIRFRKDQPPEFKLASDLNRVGIEIAAIGWSKPRNGTGKLNVAGVLGEDAAINEVTLSAAGLNAEGGRVSLREGGGLDTARFDRVQVGDWLDAPITLTGRGNGVAPALNVTGGTLDVRKTSFGNGRGSTGQSTGGPINMAMDRVVVSEGITLTDFDAKLDSNGGLSGDFTARVNGATRIAGALAPEKNGVAIRIQSTNAGALLRSAGLLENAKGGTLDVTLRPRAKNGVYRGRLDVQDTRIVDASAMAELINLVSVVGLLDQLNGSGISFSEVEADFILSPRSVELIRSSAVGPSIGISMDGTFDMTNSKMRLQGVLSPVYFLNGIGRMFAPRDGEGLFGFNFRISGTTDDPDVSVNPLSILTPGMFREIFRRPPPKVNQ